MKNSMSGMTVLLSALINMTLAGCVSTNNSSSTFTSSVLENKKSFEEIIPVEAAIYLPDEFISKMPVFNDEGSALWQSYFINCVSPLFEKATVIANLGEINVNPKISVIVKPELWGYYFQSYYRSWTCWLEFRYKISDRQGKTIAIIASSGKSFGPDKSKALAAVLKEAVAQFQKDAVKNKEAILLKSRSNL